MYCITNDLQVDRERQIIILDNGQEGDARTWLCCAPGVGPCAGQTIYYVATNGNPTAFLDGQENDNLAICAELRTTPAAIAAELKSRSYGDEASQEWMIDQMQILIARAESLQEIERAYAEDFAWLRRMGQFEAEDWDRESKSWYCLHAGPDTLIFSANARITISQSEPIIEVW